MIPTVTKEKAESIEDLTLRSLGDSMRLLAEGEKSETELLADFVYEDFIKCR